jgi:hypothetical protein
MKEPNHTQRKHMNTRRVGVLREMGPTYIQQGGTTDLRERTTYHGHPWLYYRGDGAHGQGAACLSHLKSHQVS